MKKTEIYCDRCGKMITEGEYNVGVYHAYIDYHGLYGSKEPVKRDLCFDCARDSELFHLGRDKEQLERMKAIVWRLSVSSCTTKGQDGTWICKYCYSESKTDEGSIQHASSCIREICKEIVNSDSF